ncbi:MAG: cache domain-containing protein [Planctomycetes bacterium]|nr:cache domain-containing protein [Planctomycetota bacterium]
MKSLRTKIIVSFVIIVVITGATATVVGVHLIGERIIKQAQEKVGTDLNSAREIYLNEVNSIKTIVRLTAERFYIKDSLIKNDIVKLNSEIAAVRQNENLDVLTLTDNAGRVIVRSRNPALTGDSQDQCALVQKVLSEKTAFASAEIISAKELSKESADLVERAYFKFVYTPRAKPTEKTEETAGMMIKAAAPVADYNGNVLGILYGGNLINRNYKIVDKVKETVFRGQVYNGKEIGTATIFQNDHRISTNVHTRENERAIGTRLAADVYDRVLVQGQPWIERAFVVNDWYFTAYEPIKNINGRIIGILYVGLLEDKFIDMERETVWFFLSITIIGIITALGLAYFLANSITRPLRNLAQAAHKFAEGDLGQKVAVESGDEIGEVGNAFNLMVTSIKERDDKLKQQTQQVVFRSDRLAMIGQLAAGVAHEINNPLAGIRTYVKLINKEIGEMGIADGDFQKYLNLMDRETLRCSEVVRNLLNFARQTEPRLQMIDVNSVIKEALAFTEHQVILQDIKVEKNFSPLPQILADFSQLQQVFMNIIINACDAMTTKGHLSLSTHWLKTADLLEIIIQDTGSGIPADILPHIFEPFFTTKKKGTGLGLSVVYGIITQHKGTIAVDTTVGVGTTFVVKLPVNRDKAD